MCRTFERTPDLSPVLWPNRVANRSGRCGKDGVVHGITATVAAITGLGAFAVGLLLTFSRAKVRPRIVGLSAMAAGALIVLAAAAPTRAATWWMVVTGGATLVGLVLFAAALERWSARAGDPSPSLDEPPS